MFRIRELGCLVAYLLVFSLVTAAQVDVGRITGKITDATNAVFLGASVTVKNERTGEERKVTSDSNGVYVVSGLKPSTYTVRVENSGFTPAESHDVGVGVGQDVNLNFMLQPSAVMVEVNVVAQAAPLETTSANIGVNVSTNEVTNLPMNGRQMSQITLLTPGAQNSGSGAFDNIRFSGRSNQENAIRYDGVDGSSVVDASPGNLNGETSSGFRLQASLENVQEFRVESSNYSAEFGTGTGGQISVITKSGSNDYHGDLFEYLRNNALDARNFFDGPKASILKLNQFGGSFGGPIKKDKLFFFMSYEGLRQRTSRPIVETTLSAAARARAVPSIRPLLAAFPLGNAGPSANPDFDVINVPGPGSINEDYSGVRFDYNLSPNYLLYARYFRDQGSASSVQNSTGSIYSTTAVPQNGVLSLTQILSPRVLNETKFGFNGYKTRVNGIPGPSPGVDMTGVTVNLTGSVALSGIGGQAGSAGIAIPTGLIRLSSAFNGRGAPYTNYTLSFIDNLSYSRGPHTMKFGAEIRPRVLYNDQLGGTTYSFSNVNDFLNNQPSSIQYLGDLSDKSPFTGLSGVADMHQVYYIFYAQDEWKLTPRFTINYGMRWEYYQPLHEIHNKAVLFDMLNGTIAPSGTTWFQSSKNNWGPRLAFSWAPDRFNNKTVFRIGAGYYYGPGQTEDQLQPEANDRISTTISSGPQLAWPLDINAIKANYDINSPTLGYQPRAYGPGYTIPEKILQYTASVQQELPGNFVATVAYVGSQGRRLFLRGVTNLITNVATNPATGAAIVSREFGNRFSEIDFKTSGGTSHYDSLQTTLNRRFSQGLTMGMQWTWSHDIGNSGGSNDARTTALNNSFGDGERGNNTFDIRHNFNFSALYELPIGRGHAIGANFSHVADAVLGGWQVGGIVNARTGLPIEVLITRPDVVYRDNRNGNIVNSPILVNNVPVTTAIINVPGGGNSRNVRRPDLVPGVDPYLHDGVNWLNPAAFAIPQPGRFGNLGRDALRGPGLAQFDLTIQKTFRATERLSMQFRADIYDFFNHANFQAPSGGQPRFTNALGTGSSQLQPGQPFTAAAAGGNFGMITQTVSNLVGLGTNRQIQFSLRLMF